MAELPKALSTLLSDVVTFYFMAHGCHWNVEGADFSQYHSLFEQIYEDAYSSIDPIAENMRKLGEFAPCSLQSFIDQRTLDFKSVGSSPRSMAKALLVANEKIIKTVGIAFKAATDADEQGIANFLAERDDMHKKWRWFLTAATS